MERNLSFDTEGLENIAVHLGWAQLEMFADEVDKVQVMAAGDDSSVEDLRIAVKDGMPDGGAAAVRAFRSTSWKAAGCRYACASPASGRAILP